MGDFPKFSPNDNLNFVVGDLFQAKQELVRYELGEIASINNLLAGSYLKMKNFHEEQIESSLYEEEEFESEETTKTSQSSQQMMSEVSRNKLSRSNSFSVGGDVSGSYGTVKFNAYADSNNNQSKQQSKETAKEFASQIVNESEKTVRERKLVQAYSRNLEIIRKEEEYGFDNRGGGHVVGIKCFVNEVHKVTLLNHNKHLFSTIILAHPSEAYKEYLYKNNIASDSESLENPVKPLMVKEKVLNNSDSEKEIKLLPKDINNGNWQSLAFHFGVSSEDLPLPIASDIKIATGKKYYGKPSGANDEIIENLDFEIPDGYKPISLDYGVGSWSSGKKEELDLYILDSLKTTLIPTGGYGKGSIPLENTNILELFPQNKITVSLKTKYSYIFSFQASIKCKKVVSDLEFETWQLDFYNALKNAQKSNQEESPMAFLDNLGVGKVDFRNNPTLANKFIKNELQRCVLQQVFGSDLNGFSALDRETINELEYPNCDLEKLSKLSPLLTYLNSVFDFDKMTYRFLSNYLGAKWNREEIYADTPVGPLKDFMEASFAQMILPVARGMEHRFRYFMLTNGMVFEGEDVPVIDDEISLSILDELSDDPSLLKEDDEAVIVSTNEIKLPSPHIMLQKEAILPDYSDPLKKPIPVDNINPTKGEGNAE
ncbi:hypothetical protein [Polaribacter sp. Z022]|uniref:hypothetical protein n=1 Tax=Polaribacter sp. Z022 TaxID=2927125 RepID=UPI00201FEDA6|nr:hypothetical protein [Polaribacter sp. Z022]MCL7755124.1 hypothetical protein [Polaribacter sp. Z022]